MYDARYTPLPILLIGFTVWFYRHFAQRLPSIEAILPMIHPSPCSTMDQYVLPGLQTLGDPELWAQIGGWEGLKSMHENSQWFVFLAQHLNEADTSDHTFLLLHHRFIHAFVIGCRIEAACCFRMREAPRYCAHICLQLYWEAEGRIETISRGTTIFDQLQALL